MIDQHDFNEWRRHPVTVKLYEALERLRESVNMELTSSKIIMHANSEKILAHLVGQRDSLDRILQTQLDDIDTGESEDDKRQTSGTPSTTRS